VLFIEIKTLFRAVHYNCGHKTKRKGVRSRKTEERGLECTKFY
jgi:hypothetical protein